MENIETGSGSLKEHMQLTNQLRDNCEQLLTKYGKVEKVSKFTTSFQRLGKVLGLRHIPPEASSKKFEVDLEIGGEKEEIIISSTSEDPTASEFIIIMGEKHMNELYLGRGGGLILENWGMGESVYNEEKILESPSFGRGGTGREYTNPRQASIEEIRPYKLIVDAVLRNYPIA